MVVRPRFGISRCLVTVLTVFCLVLLSPGSAYGAERGGVLQLSPVRQSLTISPGKSGQIKIHVSNPTDRTIELQPLVEDFTARDSSGTPSVFMGPNESGGRSFRRLVGEIDPVSVQSGEDKEVAITVTVPSDAAPGGYYGAIRFTPVKDLSASNLSTNAASLVLLNVPGDAKEDVTIKSFQVEPSGKSIGKFWFGGGTAKIGVTFANRGAIHEAPVGQIYLQHASDVVEKIDFNHDEPKSYILPDSDRSWQFEMGNFDQFGRYSVGAVFTYGSNNQTIEVVQSFWVVPLVYVAGAGVVVILAGMLIVSLLLRRSSRRNRA